MSENNDPLRPVVLAAFATEMEASLLLPLLEQANVKAHMVGGAIAGFRAETPAEVHVMVTAIDLPVAQKVLKDFESEQQAPVDWDQVDVGEPEDE